MITNSAHIPAYRRFDDDFEIAAVSDINETAARDTSKRHGIRSFYTNAEEMLEKEKPDLVSVCVPNCFHKEYTLMALNYGANVLCEKPLAFNFADAKEMFEHIGYKELMKIDEEHISYIKDNLKIVIKARKDIILIEIETNEVYKDVESLEKAINELDIPFDHSNYYVKKAEEELEKIKKNR